MIIRHRALASDVLCVAVRRVDGWTAYVKSVPGDCHEDEAQGGADRGTKLDKRIAFILFPELDEKEWCA